jgi:transcriptional regulator with XRE-family HTH domain
MTRAVADLCQEHGLSVEQLAEKSGLAVDRTTAIVLGRWTPSPAERAKVAEALGVSIDEVAWGHKTPIQHIYGHGPS